MKGQSYKYKMGARKVRARVKRVKCLAPRPTRGENENQNGGLLFEMT